MLENSLREHMDAAAPRAMAVLNPLRVVIENYPEGRSEELEASNHPRDEAMGSRNIPFSRVIFIEREDFMEEPAKKFFRLAPGKEVRLRYAYFITCNKVIKDPSSGEIVELRCSYDPATRGGDAPDGRKVKGTLHWVSEEHGLKAEVRLYDRLFNVPVPEKSGDAWLENLNPESETILQDCVIEPILASAAPESYYQFERLGYFCADRFDHGSEHPVFNRIVTLKDTWAKISNK